MSKLKHPGLHSIRTKLTHEGKTQKREIKLELQNKDQNSLFSDVFTKNLKIDLDVAAQKVNTFTTVITDETTSLKWLHTISKEGLLRQGITFSVPNYLTLPEYERQIAHMKATQPGLNIESIKDGKPLEKIALQTGIDENKLKTTIESIKAARNSGLPAKLHYAFSIKGPGVEIETILEKEPKELEKNLKDAKKEGIIELPGTIKDIILDLDLLRPRFSSLKAIGTFCDKVIEAKLVQKLQAGGINNLAELANKSKSIKISPKHIPSYLWLQAQANLALLSPDLKVNAQLIERGITSGIQIQKAPVAQLNRLFSGIKGVDVPQVKAIAGVHQSEAAKIKATLEPINDDQDYRIPATKDPCDCQDCESALSPLAYLTDLMNYAVKNLEWDRSDYKMVYFKKQYEDAFYLADLYLNSGGEIKLNPFFLYPKAPDKDSLELYGVPVRLGDKVISDAGLGSTIMLKTKVDKDAKTIGPDPAIDQDSELLGFGSKFPGRFLRPLYQLRNKNRNYFFTTSPEEVDYLLNYNYTKSGENPLGENDKFYFDSKDTVLAYVLDDQLDFKTLDDLLYQNISALPAACAEMNNVVRQVRICIEVLRNYIQRSNDPKISLAHLGKDHHYDTHYNQYLWNVYNGLLKQLGTSYNELVQSLSGTPENRQALANKMGLYLPDPKSADALQDWVLVPGKGPVDKYKTLTEDQLELLFGYQDTRREPLSSGVKSLDQNAQIIRWRFEGVRVGENTDNNGILIGTLIKVGNNYQVALYKHKSKQLANLVALGTINKPFGRIDLTQQNNSGVYGYVEINYLNDDLEIQFFTTSQLYINRLNVQRHNWLEQDHRPDVYSLDWDPQEEQVPIIDPDLIGPDDFRYPDPAKKAFKIWEKRYKWLGFEWDEIKQGAYQVKINDRKILDIDALFKWMKKTNYGRGREINCWSQEKMSIKNLLSLTKAAQIEKEETDQKKALKSKYHLDFEMAVRLAELVEKSTNEELREEEWKDIHNILIQVKKTYLYPVWIEEERVNNIELSTEHFWIAFSEPKVGAWPIESAAQSPLIDPRSIGASDLPDITVGRDALELWKKRRTIAKYTASQINDWIAEEVRYKDKAWKLRKACLPPWRADSGRRREWQRALTSRNRLAWIDPDLISPAYIVLKKDNPAIELHDQRRAAVKAKADEIHAYPHATSADIDKLIKETISEEGAKLIDDLEQSRDAVSSFSKRLAQYGLSNVTYEIINRVYQQVKKNADLAINPKDWEDLVAILTQIWKANQYFKWNEEERQKGITLSPDFFKIPEQKINELPELQPRVFPKWRADQNNFWNWENKLKNRIEERDNIGTELNQIIGNAEEENLPLLRNALIQYLATQHKKTFEEQVNWIYEQLFINAKMSGEGKATRISQAINSIQILLWGVKNGLIQDAYPLLKLSNEDNFEKDWHWLGSYESWRSAIFVFLYPENVLSPTLRRKKSPGMKQLEDALRNRTNISKQIINKALEEYKHYFEDVSTLDNLHCVEGVKGKIYGFDKSDYLSNEPKTMKLFFALSGRDHSLYWSTTYTNSAFSGDVYFNQNYWSKLTQFSDHIVEIVGTFQYRLIKDDLLGIVVITQKLFDYKVVFFHINLMDGEMSGEMEIKTVKNNQPKVTILEGKTPSSPPQFELVYQEYTRENKQEQKTEKIGLNKTLEVDTSKVYFDEVKNWGAIDKLKDKYGKTISAGKFENNTKPGGGFSIALNPENGQIEVFYGTNQEKSNNTDGVIFYYFTLNIQQYSSNSSWEELLKDNRPGKYDQKWLGGAAYGQNGDLYLLISESYNRGNDFVHRRTIFVKKKGNVEWSEFVIYDSLDASNESGLGSGVSWNSLFTRSDICVFEHGDNHYLLYIEIGLQGQCRFFRAEISNGQLSNWKSLDLAATANNKDIFKKNTSEIGAAISVAVADINNDLEPEIVLFFMPEEGPAPGQKENIGYYQVLSDINIDSWRIGRPGPVKKVGEDNLEKAWFGNDNLGASIVLTPPDENNPAKLVIYHADRAQGGTEMGQNVVYKREGELGIKKAKVLTSSCSTPINRIKPLSLSDYNVSFDKRRRSGAIDLVYKFLPEIHSQAYHPRNQEYYDEFFYFVPMFIALQYQRVKQYEKAIAWYNLLYLQNEITSKKLKDGNDSTNIILKRLEYAVATSEKMFQRTAEWYEDPMNPHSIAARRGYAYHRYNLQNIVRCLIEYADEQFTKDTPETLAKANKLYYEALKIVQVLKDLSKTNACSEKIGNLVSVIGDRYFDRPVLELNEGELIALEDMRAFFTAASMVGTQTGRIEKTIRTDLRKFSQEIKLSELNEIVGKIRNDQFSSFDLNTVQQKTLVREEVFQQKVFQQNAEKWMTTQEEVKQIHLAYLRSKNQVKMVEPSLPPQPTVGGIPLPGGIDDSPKIDIDLDKAIEIGQKDPTKGQNPTEPSFVDTWLPPSKNTLWFGQRTQLFCVSANPIPEVLELKIKLNLRKLQTSRNIAGMKREIQSYYGAATDQITGIPVIGANGQLINSGVSGIRPSMYRYPVLIARAKELIQLAQQIENLFMASLEHIDDLNYQKLSAQQNIQIKAEQVKLKSLEVKEAKDQLKLSELQRDLVNIQINTFGEWLAQGMMEMENDLIQLYMDASLTQIADAFASGAAEIGIRTVELAEKSSFAAPHFLLSSAALISRVQGINYNQQINQSNVRISAGYRRMEWEYQYQLAIQNLSISEQTIDIKEDEVEIKEQNQNIAELESRAAKDTLEYLNNRFLDTEMYEWVSEVLEGVYEQLLQEATGIARMAHDQLAFERQEAPTVTIKSDYWLPVNEDVLLPNINEDSTSSSTERRGLTGSARLLNDIIKLDQYAFTNNRRKQQITKTISLVELDPIGFQRFRERGAMKFSTRQTLFDRDFPGGYLRLIKRVRLSVIALIPPNQGIKATLGSFGISRAVIGGDLFQEVIIRRDPEIIALSSPINATGLFELEPMAATEILMPFEGSGVDMEWEFKLPKSANPIDYYSIADVLMTVEYTALFDSNYADQVKERLGNRYEGDRIFSFRNELMDQWYDLNNPQYSDHPMVVSFNISKFDFPPNLVEGSLLIQNLSMYFSLKKGLNYELQAKLQFTDEADSSYGGLAQTNAQLISTSSNGGEWITILNVAPIGEWKLDLSGLISDGGSVRKAFENKEIMDIVFVVSYVGQLQD